ncbi:hypothetical protein L484_013921 [Morus notabilis]|uniref:Uncharacterized protein n=1 Tax=Morus notabilis TaxID=981085 RepID=W9QJ49_9ROSA|nr:hypothetical protein L484_013921 [Morus notabilis]
MPRVQRNLDLNGREALSYLFSNPLLLETRTKKKRSVIRESSSSSAGTVFSKGSEVSRGEEASCSPIRSSFRSR